MSIHKDTQIMFTLRNDDGEQKDYVVVVVDDDYYDDQLKDLLWSLFVESSSSTKTSIQIEQIQYVRKQCQQPGDDDDDDTGSKIFAL